MGIICYIYVLFIFVYKSKYVKIPLTDDDNIAHQHRLIFFQKSQ